MYGVVTFGILYTKYCVWKAEFDEIFLCGIDVVSMRRPARELYIPAIGIGAGPGCDGQVLFIRDMLHLYLDVMPRFAKVCADIGAISCDALQHFCEEVRDGRFPGKKHCY